ncbi:alpha/beta hydrolase [Novosphingobium resinovorum]|uniref:alpha/beta fold hydrolase n=1 Tax=Novosphingobium resinovorum TaxID=158500 RepID=UPI002ED05264|nr:alpha/beta hydrolase [Novosphingobium resinovorum]
MSAFRVDRRRLLATAGLAGATLAARPVLASEPAGGAGWSHEGFVDRAGGRMHWASIGEGPVLVVMPKLGGWIADWRDVALQLANRYRVVAIDPPGHGGSVFPGPVPHVQTLPESAAMVRAMLAALGIERYSLAGNSLGGCVAAIMAALFPDEVENLALVSVAVSERMNAADLAAYDARDGGYDTGGMPLPRPVEEMAARFGATPQIAVEMNASRAAAGLWIRPSERGVFTCGIAGYLPRIASRTLLVYGTANAGAYRGYRDTALRSLPRASAVDVPGAGAFLHQQKPEETAVLLDRFLSGSPIG